MVAVGALYATPEIRLRVANQPLEVGGLGNGSGQLLRVGDLGPPPAPGAPERAYRPP